MQFKRQKYMTALLSIISVSIALSAVVIDALVSDGFSSRSIMWLIPFAAVLAGASAAISIILSQRLSKKREQRWVFLVYAREDIKSARKLAADLRESDLTPWLDVEMIMPGEIWRNSVLRALEQSAVALILISEHIYKKGFIQKEIELALDVLQDPKTDISPVIPVRLDETQVPDSLSHIHWVNLFEENGLERLLRGLHESID